MKKIHIFIIVGILVAAAAAIFFLTKKKKAKANEVAKVEAKTTPDAKENRKINIIKPK